MEGKGMKYTLIFLLLLSIQSTVSVAQELEVYALRSFYFSDTEKVGFVSLTDRYQWETSVISKENLGDTVFEGDNYHELSLAYRNRFLSTVKISEEDQVFVHNLLLDSTMVFPVRSLRLVAHLSAYGTSNPVEQEEYHIGFELNEDQISLKEMGDYYSNTFINIGKENPFRTGQTHAIAWEETEVRTTLPHIDLTEYQAAVLAEFRYDSTIAFECRMIGLSYYVQNLIRDDQVIGRHLIVKEHKMHSVVFQKIYLDTEGTYLLPLNFPEEGREPINYQWTGNLFNDRGPCLFGFLGNSFGCPDIDFLDEDKPSIYIQCDNRH